MRKLSLFLSSVAIMAVLTFLQGLFLVESDTGKQWAVMARWFGLCNGVLRIPKTIQFPLANHKPQLCRPHARHP